MNAANDNLQPVPAGFSYYPEMGERPPIGAIIEASLSHYGRHYYLKFAESDCEQVMAAIKDTRVRFTNLEAFDTIKGVRKMTLRMTVAAYGKLRAKHAALCTSAILLD